MIERRPPKALNPRIRAEAAEWLLRFSEGEIDSAGSDEFNHWLRSSPEHVRAYLRVSALWQEVGPAYNRQGRRDLAALVTEAGRERNVFPLAFGTNPGEVAAVPAARSGHWFLQPKLRFGAIAAALFLAIGTPGVYKYLTRNIYETRVGEQRVINLPDGSTVILNADSRVRVDYEEMVRTIDLEAGQALFKVAKNPSRPFVVRSGNTQVRAVGTQFDVYRKNTGTAVTVVEGKVAVSARKAGGAGHRQLASSPMQTSLTHPHAEAPAFDTEGAGSLFLTAGEQLIVSEAIGIDPANASASGEATPKVHLVEVKQATAWTQGLLVFDGTPLAEVVQEFNRQNTKSLVLQSPGLANIKISGTFPASGSERITRFLRERFGVVVNETDDKILLSRP